MSEKGSLAEGTLFNGRYWARTSDPLSLAEPAALGVARVSWATLLHRAAMAHFEERLASLQQ
jgi:hypothetical protein